MLPSPCKISINSPGSLAPSTCADWTSVRLGIEAEPGKRPEEEYLKLGVNSFSVLNMLGVPYGDQLTPNQIPDIGLSCLLEFVVRQIQGQWEVFNGELESRKYHIIHPVLSRQGY